MTGFAHYIDVAINLIATGVVIGGLLFVAGWMLYKFGTGAVASKIQQFVGMLRARWIDWKNRPEKA